MLIQNEPKGSPLKSLVLKLGGFHTEMSFVGCIGYLMSGSGLVSILETVYAATAVTHMMTGKAIARAVRGHFLVDTALTALIISNIYGIPTPTIDMAMNNIEPESNADSAQDREESVTYSDEITESVNLLDSFVNGETSLKDIENSKALVLVKEKMDLFRESCKKYRTANLWFQYMDMLAILRQFIRAERTGDWRLHLESLKAMLPFFAASGHNLYAKSVWVYLNQMEGLADTHPDIAALFEKGFHVIRRTDNYWAGISSDLAIEQVLMRGIKTTGGLTRGRGMNECQRALWILSMPDCAAVNNAMQSVTATNFYSSDQHKEEGISRQKRDTKDTMTITSFLRDRNPFVEQEDLRNIETGVTASSDVNVDKAKGVGIKILSSMEGEEVRSFKFKKKHQAITFDDKPSRTAVEGAMKSIDPQLLFQRFIVAADCIYEDKTEIFKYELSSQPSSMFDSMGCMRAAQKANLADAIWRFGDCSAEKLNMPNDCSCVIDGGSLIHKLPWEKGLSFGEIIDRYVASVKRIDAVSITVVFDGYSAGPSTKDAMHLKRTKGIFGSKVTFTEKTPFMSKKETFLANSENKQCFIELLSKTMQENGIVTKHADVLIAKTAIQSALKAQTVLLGEDTDLLVLLLFFYESSSSKLVFRPNNDKMTIPKIWDIGKTKDILGDELCEVLPVIHGITGCDTTSKLFGIGKGSALKKFADSSVLKEVAYVFLKESSKEDVLRAGEFLITSLYGGAQSEGLDILRYNKFANKVLVSKQVVQVHTLPPTAEAASHHILRTYQQVQSWVGDGTLNPSDFGWDISNGKMMPIKMKNQPAPQRLLSIIRCNCKTNCDNKRCTCKKHGLDCNLSCGECRGQNCSNSGCEPMENEEAVEYE